AELDHVRTAGDLFPNGLVRVESVTRLVNIGQVNSLTDADRALVRLFLAGQHAEQCRLTSTVRSDHTNDATGGQLEVQIIDQQAVAVALGEVFDFDHHIAKALAGRNDDLGV